jgi:hypothetical protein
MTVLYQYVSEPFAAIRGTTLLLAAEAPPKLPFG